MDFLSYLILKHYSTKCSQIEIKIHRDKKMFGVHPIEKSCCDSEALSEESERRSVQLAER